MTKMQLNKNNGFTLIELMVVISIIGMLSSIILTSLQSARKKGDLASVITFDAFNYHKLGNTLISKYDFDDSSNPGKDSSGNGYDLTLVGATIDTSTTYNGSGGSLNIANAGQYASKTFSPSIPIPATGSKGFTISLWTKASVINNSANIIRFNSPGMNNISCNNSLLWTFIKGAINTLSSTVCTDTNNFHNITYVSNSGQGEVVYIDGKVIGTSASYLSSFNLSQMAIGSDTGYSFVGNIDNVKLYNESLLASDVQKLYVEGLKTHQIAQR